MLSDTSVSDRDCGWGAPSACLLGTRAEWCCQHVGGKGCHRDLDRLGPMNHMKLNKCKVLAPESWHPSLEVFKASLGGPLSNLV